MTLNTAARKSYAATDKAINAITKAHQPFLQSQADVTSTLISSGINLAVQRYKIRRLTRQNNHTADIARFILDIAWAFLEPIVWALVTTIIYGVVSLAIFGSIFYILFIL